LPQGTTPREVHDAIQAALPQRDRWIEDFLKELGHLKDWKRSGKAKPSL